MAEYKSKKLLKKDLQRLLELATCQLWRLSLTRNIEWNAKLFQRMLEPRIGDLVVETTTIYMPQRRRSIGIGYLRDITYKSRGKHKYPIYHIQTPRGTITRWENASFIPLITEDIFQTNMASL